LIDARSELKRGLAWFGSITLLTRLLDLGALLVLLHKMTRADMGLASLVAGVAVVFEAFNGLGVGVALIQAKEVSRRELDSVFWFSCAVGVGLALLMGTSAPLFASFYKQPALASMLVTGALKMIFVGAALVPLQLMARDLKFRGAGMVQTGATALEALTKIVLVLAGLGAWSLVIAGTARGLYTLVVVYLLAPYWPKPHFRMDDIRRFLGFGLRNTFSSAIFYAYKNADYFFIGRYLGIESLGIYRVGFDVAMTPLEVVIQIVNRVAFPVYSRIAHEPKVLAEAFERSCRYVFLLVGPCAVLLFFGAEDAVRVLAHPRWLAAIPIVRILCWAALLRGLAQLFPQLYYAVGRAEYAVYDALLSLFLLVGGFYVALAGWGQRYGTMPVCLVWVLVYPFLIVALLHWTRRVAAIEPIAIARALLPVFGGLLAMAVPLGLLSAWHPPIGALGRVIMFLVVGLSAYALYLRAVLGLSVRNLRPK
jgi:O-antigen/teichoic acid export membrane protein